MSNEKNILFKLIMVGVICLSACKSGGDKTADTADSTMQDTASREMVSIDQIKSARGIRSQPVEFQLAEDCIKEFLATNPAKIPKTTHISFAAAPLKKWVASLDTATYDTIRVTMGIYTPKFVETYNNPDRKGRLTVFLMPYKGDKPAVDKSATGILGNTKPFNLGEIHP